MSTEKKEAPHPIAPVIEVVLMGLLRIALAPLMGLIGLASIVCRWGADQFRKSI